MNEADTPSGLLLAPPPLTTLLEAAPMLADLAEARSIAMRFLRRMDDVAAGMSPEERVAALAEDGQLVLNVTRMDRALRQIVVLEEEVMGRRLPPAGRGPVVGPAIVGAGGPATGRKGDPRGRHDFNDVNDLNDLDDLSDTEEVAELRAEVSGLFDLDDPREREIYADLAAFEHFATYKDYEKGRRRDPDLQKKEYERLDNRLMEELMRIAEAREQPGYDPMKPSGKTAAELAAAPPRYPFIPAKGPSPEEKWRARRDAVLRLRKAEKRLIASGRGPPDGQPGP